MAGPILSHISASTSRLAALRQDLAVLLEEPAPEEAQDHASGAAMFATMAPEALQSDSVLGKIPAAGASEAHMKNGTSDTDIAGPPSGFLQPLQPGWRKLPPAPPVDSDIHQKRTQEGTKRGTAFSDEVLMAVISRIAVPTPGNDVLHRLHAPSNLSSRIRSRMNSAVVTPRGVAPPAPRPPSGEELADAMRVSLLADQLVRKIASKLGGSSAIWDSAASTPAGGATPRVWGNITDPPARQLHDLASQRRVGADPAPNAASQGAIDGGWGATLPIAGAGVATGAPGAAALRLAGQLASRSSGLPPQDRALQEVGRGLVSEGELDALIERKMAAGVDDEVQPPTSILRGGYGRVPLFPSTARSGRACELINKPPPPRRSTR